MRSSSGRRRGPSSTAATAAAVLVLGAVTACSASDQGAGPAASPAETTAPLAVQPDTPSDQPAPPAEPVAPAEPAVVALSPEEYQQELTRRTTRVSRALDRVGEAPAYKTLARSVARAATAAESARDRLSNVVPPEEVAETHERLVRGLRRLATGLEQTAAALDDRALCAPSSVLARVGDLPARTPLRLATRELREAGYDLPRLVPKVVRMQTRRLATGDFVFVEARSGFGTLAVQNGLSVDGVVVLTQGKTPVSSMYVRRNDFGLIGGIPDGTYRAYFTLGMDWDDTLRRFTRRCSFARFDDPMSFETISSGSSIQYSSYSVTLHAVAGGTASTSDVAPDSFPGG